VSLLLRGVHVADGSVADVGCRDGVITEVAAPGAAGRRHDAPGPPAYDEIVDLPGFLLLPAPAEPHAHLDKALTADLADNPVGDLAGAIVAMRELMPRQSLEQTVERATAAALILLRSGATAIRTHVDAGPHVGVRGLEALAVVRERLAGLVDLQVAVLPGAPLTGVAGAEGRAVLRDALALADVVGGCPHIDPDPLACQAFCYELAGEAGLPLDLHTDETLDPAALHLAALPDLVEAGGLGAGVTASHCVSLGMQPLEVQRRVAGRLAATGIGVLTLPQTNLFLQARGQTCAPPRGLTAIGALRTAGVTLGAGGDNLRDPFNVVGRGDPLEIAALLVAAGHLRPADAYQLVSGGARGVMGLPAVRVEPGSPAELLAVRAAGVGEAVAGGPAERVVVHAGRVVARTQVTTWVAAVA